jgi:hypothetical protein
MDRKAAVIRAEMSQTRAALDHKLTLLEAHARQFNPRKYVRRYVPEYLLDRAIGGILTLVGLRLTLRQLKHYRASRNRRARFQAALVAREVW